MVQVIENARHPLEYTALHAMFEARKRVFVDLLKWDVAVIDGRFEIDRFDDERAVYLIVSDRTGRHRASARLLATTRPHILDTLFAELCALAPPRGASVREITRFCLDRDQSARERREARDALIAGLVDYALANGITTYTGVAELGWLQQILAFGWRCRPLGLPRKIDGMTLGALAIDIGADTPGLLAQNGIHAALPLEPQPAPKAA